MNLLLKILIVVCALFTIAVTVFHPLMAPEIKVIMCVLEGAVFAFMFIFHSEVNSLGGYDE